MTYIAQFEPDATAGGFVVTFPDIGDGVTQGETEEEAMEMAADLLGCMIGERMKRGLDLPLARKHRGNKYRPVRLPALQEAKAELYNAFRAAGVRKAELSRRIGISKTNIDRLFDLNYHSRLEQIEAAFRALGKELAIQIRDAA
jgi:antitoxin HicB